MSAPMEYVTARKVLLDTLDLLQPHVSSLILVGAQGVYERTGPTTIGGVAYTTDSDLLLDADLLAAEPEITQTLNAGGFREGPNPGSWQSPNGVAVDLMVTPHQSGRTKPAARSAALPPHGRWLARVTPGLEPALVDHSPMPIGALEPSDNRRYELQVAGPAALITAKLVKIRERLESGGVRVRDKDAVDVLRLLVATATDRLVIGFRLHASEPVAAEVTRRALEFLTDQHAQGDRSDVYRLIWQGTGNDRTALAQFEALVDDLLAACSAR
jgi:hypothetical protein